MKFYYLFFCFIPLCFFSQNSAEENLSVIISNGTSNKSKVIADLIPKKSKGLYGFINQNSKMMIPPKYTNVGFFTEDCTLLNSPKAAVKKFGSADYASAIRNGKEVRIDKNGRTVYEVKKADLGKCTHAFVKQKYYGFSENGVFGIKNSENHYKNSIQILPQYQLVHIMEGDDLENPMIIVVKNDLFGIVDKNNNVIVPIIYSDIKRNFSWKLAGLFEVTKDGKNYFYVDVKNNRY